MIATNASSACSMPGMPKLTQVWKITSITSRGVAPLRSAPRMWPRAWVLSPTARQSPIMHSSRVLSSTMPREYMPP